MSPFMSLPEGVDGQGSGCPVSSSGETSVPSVAVQIFGVWDLKKHGMFSTAVPQFAN